MLETIRENWQKIKETVRNEYYITNVSYNTWIEPLEIYDMKGSVLRIYFVDANDFAIGYVTRKYSVAFQVTIEEITGFHVNIEFIQDPGKNEGRLFFQGTESVESVFKGYSKLNPRYTFDSFVVGANNKFAHAASLSVAESPGQEYNPLFIYGGPGLGKTHLMHAIANFILQNNPKARILYVTSEVFTNEVIDSIRNKNGTTMSDFRNKYRGIDILLIDDIQFIIGKEATEEEFFHTFNYLYENRKQIVLSSDKPPRAYTSLAERLRSRFEMGLTVDISLPDYETRMAILRKKEETDGYTIDNEILQYIAQNIKANIRELEGALTKMYAYSKLHQNAPLTLEIAKENLKDIINPETEKKLTPDHIIEVVAEHYGVRPQDMKSQKRTEDIVRPRQVAMYLIRLLNDISLKEVGKYLGNRDHSTVIHGYTKIQDELGRDQNLENTIEVLKKKLTQG
ncbi:MAG: chromosomal replication initiator protein DnaA [Lachnospiraceae bacterium]|nr:chromosomal replication initiator protein DnaA [Lachnospiraceae bacterium]MBP5255176.1 chromosomal replication initiator protein DnaA [Lachnospiraceae bacterium]